MITDNLQFYGELKNYPRIIIKYSSITSPLSLVLIYTLQDGEIIKGSCGGLCGWCSPEFGIQLQVLS